MKRGQKKPLKQIKLIFLVLTVVGWNLILKCRRIINPAERIYSSATNYQEMESIIEIEILSQRLITIK